MNIFIFVLIVTVAAFAGSMAGSFMACEKYLAKRKKRREPHGRE